MIFKKVVIKNGRFSFLFGGIFWNIIERREFIVVLWGKWEKGLCVFLLIIELCMYRIKVYEVM